MRYLALACDYDGTLAHDGTISETTIAALENLLASGRKLILVTGRELDDLLKVCPRCDLFEWIVAENGCLLYRPATQEELFLYEAPPVEFAAALRALGVPVSIGKVIVSTWVPHEVKVLEVIRQFGLELQVIFNKGAVMILPAGHNKASGLTAALDKMGLSPHNVVGIGDAENDHAFLDLCGCGVAVANALPMLKDKADFVTQGENGSGVAELANEIVENDLAEREDLLVETHLLLAQRDDDGELRVAPLRANILLAGPSGGGKSTIIGGLLERLTESHYQVCVIDPEGDYDKVEGMATLGQPDRPPTVDEVLGLLKKAQDNIAINMVGIVFKDRPEFFVSLLTRLQELRAKTGRPHFVIVDEAHHVLPESWQGDSLALPPSLKGLVFITVEPKTLHRKVLAAVDMVLAIGAEPEKIFTDFATAADIPAPPLTGQSALERGEILVWQINPDSQTFKARGIPGQAQRRRHLRKYAEGDLGPERSFYFRGRDGKLNLKAQNLIIFMQIADGLDDKTWEYHLRRGDYSQWFKECIKDEALADEAIQIETNKKISSEESRKLIKAAITRRFTLPAS
ncbi:MAG TPA: HAD family hydrolase [Candidatus Limnocylindrales bacterium]|nr:HAD family hydrolase [Candidatus Limnocylindrales bacterium]